MMPWEEVPRLATQARPKSWLQNPTVTGVLSAAVVVIAAAWTLFVQLDSKITSQFLRLEGKIEKVSDIVQRNALDVGVIKTKLEERAKHGSLAPSLRVESDQDIRAN